MAKMKDVEGRVSRSYDRIEGAYKHRSDGVLPYLVADVNYFLTGEAQEKIPADFVHRSAGAADHRLDPGGARRTICVDV